MDLAGLAAVPLEISDALLKEAMAALCSLDAVDENRELPAKKSDNLLCVLCIAAW
jgi:hypothetical protein